MSVVIQYLKRRVHDEECAAACAATAAARQAHTELASMYKMQLTKLEILNSMSDRQG